MWKRTVEKNYDIKMKKLSQMNTSLIVLGHLNGVDKIKQKRNGCGIKLLPYLCD